MRLMDADGSGSIDFDEFWWDLFYNELVGSYIKNANVLLYTNLLYYSYYLVP